jgi:hypothetical protein
MTSCSGATTFSDRSPTHDSSLRPCVPPRVRAARVVLAIRTNWLARRVAGRRSSGNREPRQKVPVRRAQTAVVLSSRRLARRSPRPGARPATAPDRTRRVLRRLSGSGSRSFLPEAQRVSAGGAYQRLSKVRLQEQHRGVRRGRRSLKQQIVGVRQGPQFRLIGIQKQNLSGNRNAHSASSRRAPP